MDENTARKAAATSANLIQGMTLGDARELRDGWFFPFSSNGTMAGCNGVIVNKQTRKLFHLGSAFPPERDLDLYDRGYQFDRYDLVIVRVTDRKQTVRALRNLRLQVVEPREEHGTVWRVPRDRTDAELSEMIDSLPCLVPAARLYFVAEVLEHARRKGWFAFELREHVPHS